MKTKKAAKRRLPIQDVIKDLLCDDIERIVAARDLLAAVRGPDHEDKEIKAWFTAPVRLFLFGETLYRRCGFQPPTDAVTSLRSRQTVDKLFDRLRTAECNNHYRDHIKVALHAVAAFLKARRKRCRSTK